MPVVDMHAHLSPEGYKEAIRTKGAWYGLDAGPGEPDSGRFAHGARSVGEITPNHVRRSVPVPLSEPS